MGSQGVITGIVHFQGHWMRHGGLSGGLSESGMGLLFHILKCSSPGWLRSQLMSFKVVSYCVRASAATQSSFSAGAPWEPG